MGWVTGLCMAHSEYFDPNAVLHIASSDTSVTHTHTHTHTHTSKEGFSRVLSHDPRNSRNSLLLLFFVNSSTVVMQDVFIAEIHISQKLYKNKYCTKSGYLFPGVSIHSKSAICRIVNKFRTDFLLKEKRGRTRRFFFQKKH